MPTKIFSILGGSCPFGKGIEIDSAKCRNCEYYYRAGTGTFFWCRNPDVSILEASKPKPPEPEKRKRGRPPGKAKKKPVKRIKKKKQ